MKAKKTLLAFSLLLIGVTALQAQTTSDSIKAPKFRFGGYGEILYQQMDFGPDRYKDPAGAPADNRAYITLPRTVFQFEYKLRKDISFVSELEFEYGGTGSAMELEYEEGGEYEMEVEKAGEVMLEQLYIAKEFSKLFTLKAGHVIVPVGLTNAHHEPIFFFGSVRPEGETSILPSTWHETGLAITGKFKAFNYELMMVNGLDPNGFSSNYWIKGGKQGIFENTTMTSPAYAGRFELFPLRNLRLGLSGYHNKTAKNASKPDKTEDINATVQIATADIQYQTKNFIARANYVYGHLSDSKRLSQINKSLSKNTGFPRTPVAEVASTYAIEAGYNILSLFKTKEKLMPFMRYEYYNCCEKMDASMAEVPINKRSVVTAGLNYFMLPNLVIKADYSMRKIDNGNYNQENTFGLAIGYTGWFIEK